MTIQAIPLSALAASRGNPRGIVPRKGIEGPPASIRTDGLLQSLVVRPGKDGDRHTIVSGARRFEALRLLYERGELPDDHRVNVDVRTMLSIDEALRIATVENVQRQDMMPLEEAAALTKLIHRGVTLDDVAAQTGLSIATIKRRLALNALSKAAKKALAKGDLTLAKAEA